jgi:hypothetical protein
VVIKLLDSKGQEVLRMKETLNGENTMIIGPDLKGLVSGVYYLVIVIGDETITQVIVKK